MTNLASRPSRRRLVRHAVLPAVLIVVALGASSAAPSPRRVKAAEARELGARDRASGERAARFFRDNDARHAYAEGVLGRSIDARQREVIEKADRIGAGQRGRDGRRAGIHADGTTNYTFAQIRAKAEKLKDGGFTFDEIRLLMDRGVAGEHGGGRFDKIMAGWMGALSATFGIVTALDPAAGHSADFAATLAVAGGHLLRLGGLPRKPLAVIYGAAAVVELLWGTKYLAPAFLAGAVGYWFNPPSK